MTKISLLGGASILAVGLMFASGASADPWLQVNNNSVAGLNGAVGGSNAGSSTSGYYGNASSGDSAINASKTTNGGATAPGAATTGGDAGNAAFGSAAGEGVVAGSNNFYANSSKSNWAVGAFNTQASGNVSLGSGNTKTISVKKADDGSAMSLGAGAAQALTTRDGGVIQSGDNSSAITQSGKLNIAHDAQVNIATLEAGVTGICIDTGSGYATASTKTKTPVVTQASTGNTTFTTGTIASTAVTIGDGSRGVFALAGNTGIGTSQNAIIHVNSDIAGGTGNSAFGGGY